MGLSFLITGIGFGVLQILAKHRDASRETTLSASALALAMLLPAAVIALPLPDLEMETSALMVIWLGALCWIALRCKFLDNRVAATLFFAILLREIWPYLPSENLSFNFWQFLSCIVVGLLWKREVLTGTLLAFAIWRNPYFAALVLAARVGLLQIRSTRTAELWLKSAPFARSSSSR